MEKVLTFKWTVSRGRDTYGYNICSLYVDGDKVSSCNGGGYDMKGTALAEWMESQFSEQLKGLTCNYGSGDDTEGFYGLGFRGPAPDYEQSNHYRDGFAISLHGGCGFSSMERILNAIGYKLKYITESRNETTYLLTDA